MNIQGLKSYRSAAAKLKNARNKEPTHKRSLGGYVASPVTNSCHCKCQKISLLGISVTTDCQFACLFNINFEVYSSTRISCFQVITKFCTSISRKRIQNLFSIPHVAIVYVGVRAYVNFLPLFCIFYKPA